MQAKVITKYIEIEEYLKIAKTQIHLARNWLNICTDTPSITTFAAEIILEELEQLAKQVENMLDQIKPLAVAEHINAALELQNFYGAAAARHYCDTHKIAESDLPSLLKDPK